MTYVYFIGSKAALYPLLFLLTWGSSAILIPQIWCLWMLHIMSALEGVKQSVLSICQFVNLSVQWKKNFNLNIHVDRVKRFLKLTVAHCKKSDLCVLHRKQSCSVPSAFPINMRIVSHFNTSDMVFVDASYHGLSGICFRKDSVLLKF